MLDKYLIDHPEIKTIKKFWIDHTNVIKKFSRYPHRNKTLGRQSTAEEIKFLNASKLVPPEASLMPSKEVNLLSKVRPTNNAKIRNKIDISGIAPRLEGVKVLCRVCGAITHHIF